MEGEALKLHGTRLSPYSRRVVWALKLKGIPYEYIEEDLSDKSPTLLHHNPVYKKIPLLLHGGKPICESTLIIEYIDEMWPQNYPLMPIHPHDRAVARFWVKFADDNVPAIYRMARSQGEDRERAIKESLQMLEVIEEHGLLGERKFFGGDKIGIVDLAFCGIPHWLEAIELHIGVKLLEAHKFPRLVAWIENFKQAPIIKENLPSFVPKPDHEH